MKAATITAVVSTVLVFVTSIGWSQQPDKEHAELAKALNDAKISLQRGLTASAKEGKPISAKYEVEDGKLQLSVYTMKGDKFSEVIVDHKTGKVSKTEPITQGDDLTHAKAQSEAMAKAKRTLDAAATEAVKENKGYRAVSVMPALKDSHPVAEVELVKGTDWKTVSEKLD
jgi:ribosome-binding factor A